MVKLHGWSESTGSQAKKFRSSTEGETQQGFNVKKWGAVGLVCLVFDKHPPPSRNNKGITQNLYIRYMY